MSAEAVIAVVLRYFWPNAYDTLTRNRRQKPVAVSGAFDMQFGTEFLSRVSILTRDIDIANLSIRPSVRYDPVSDENGLTYRTQFFHHTVGMEGE